MSTFLGHILILSSKSPTVTAATSDMLPTQPLRPLVPCSARLERCLPGDLAVTLPRALYPLQGLTLEDVVARAILDILWRHPERQMNLQLQHLTCSQDDHAPPVTGVRTGVLTGVQMHEKLLGQHLVSFFNKFQPEFQLPDHG